MCLGGYGMTKRSSHQKHPPKLHPTPHPLPPQPGVGINAFLFLARPCFQGKPNDAMTSMQVTSKKEQTGGIEWLPLEVFAAFSGEEGGGRGWIDEGRGKCTEIKIKNTQRSKWEPSRLTSGKRDEGGREGWRGGGWRWWWWRRKGGGTLLLHINGCRSNSQGLLEGKKGGEEK